MYLIDYGKIDQGRIIILYYINYIILDLRAHP